MGVSGSGDGDGGFVGYCGKSVLRIRMILWDEGLLPECLPRPPTRKLEDRRCWLLKMKNAVKHTSR